MGDHAAAGLLRRVARRGAGFPKLPAREERYFSLALVTACVLGVVLGYLTYRIADGNEQSRIASQFEDIAKREALALEGEIVELTEVLHSLHGLYDSSDDVTGVEFERFVRGPLERHPSIRTAAWLPSVPEAELAVHEHEAREHGLDGYRVDFEPVVGSFLGDRRIFHPVRHLQPVDATDLSVGRDLGSDPAFLDALERAALDDAPTLSDPVPCPTDDAPQVLMLLPVTEHDGAPEPTDRHVRGFVALLLRPETITGSRIHHREDMELELAVVDRDGEERPLARSAGFTPGACCEVAVPAASRVWTFRAVPRASYLRRWSTPNPVLFGIIAAGLWLGLAGVLVLGARIVREREIRRRDRNVRSLLSNLEEGVVVAAPDGHVVFANAAAGRILGLRPDRALAGRCAATWGCHLDEDGAVCDEARLPLVRALAGETVSPTHLFVRNRQLGKGRWVSMSAGPLRGPKGQLTGAVTVLRDVTELRRGHARRIEMALASDVQRKLYPRAAPHVNGYDLAGAVFSADATCGDYFDFVPISDDVICIAIGDVSGHGMGPALVMTQVRAYLRAFTQTMAAPAKIVERINRVLVEDLYEGYFVTLLVAFLDVRTGRISYVNAGHVAGQVLGVDGRVRATLDRTGLPLGLVGDRGYFARDLELAEGDTLLLMTDGLIECRNPKGEFLWDEGASEIAAAHVDEPASDLVESVYERVRAHADWQPLDDDLAIVVVKALTDGAAASPAVVHRERAPSTRGTIVHRAR